MTTVIRRPGVYRALQEADFFAHAWADGDALRAVWKEESIHAIEPKQ